MSKEHYEDDCEGCRPVLINPDTGQPLPENHPISQIVNGVFEKLSKQQKESFHKVCCLNSRDEQDLANVQVFRDEVAKKIN